MQIGETLTQVDYENVVRQLLSCGFKSDNLDGIQLLVLQMNLWIKILE